MMHGFLSASIQTVSISMWWIKLSAWIGTHHGTLDKAAIKDKVYGVVVRRRRIEEAGLAGRLICISAWIRLIYNLNFIQLPDTVMSGRKLTWALFCVYLSRDIYVGRPESWVDCFWSTGRRYIIYATFAPLIYITFNFIVAVALIYCFIQFDWFNNEFMASIKIKVTHKLIFHSCTYVSAISLFGILPWRRSVDIFSRGCLK